MIETPERPATARGEHGTRDRGGRWRKGTSGNPKGRQAGSRHRATLAAEALLDGEAEAVTRKAIEMALAGESTAIRLVLERILPVRRDRPISLDLPDIESSVDLPRASAAIIRAVASGELGLSEAQVLAAIVEQHRKTLELADIEARLAALEQERAV